MNLEEIINGILKQKVKSEYKQAAIILVRNCFKDIYNNKKIKKFYEESNIFEEDLKKLGYKIK